MSDIPFSSIKRKCRTTYRYMKIAEEPPPCERSYCISAPCREDKSGDRSCTVEATGGWEDGPRKIKSVLGSIKRPSGSRPPVPFAWRLSDAPPFYHPFAHPLRPFALSLPSLFLSFSLSMFEISETNGTPWLKRQLPGYRASDLVFFFSSHLRLPFLPPQCPLSKSKYR